MKFPVTVNHRNAHVKIYGRSKSNPTYRVFWRAECKSHFAAFKTYGEAKEFALGKAAQLAKHSPMAAMNPKAAAQLQTIFAALDAHAIATGRRLGAVEIIAAALEADKILNGAPLTEAARLYVTQRASIQTVKLADAVKQYNAERKRLTVPPKEGQRPELSPSFHQLTASWLDAFAATLPNAVVCDLHADLLGAWMAGKADTSPKTRNHHRSAVVQFLKWAVTKDYLPREHRLFEAPALRHETVDHGDIHFYTRADFDKLMAAATQDFKPVIALAGLAGIRLQEILRLTWEDVWRVPGHIEITARIAKNRARRLVTICDELAKHLKPCANATGPVCGKTHGSAQAILAGICQAAKVKRIRNGLRHGFVSYHYALHGDENLTAALAGHSPAMIHQNYRGLATKEAAEKWFAAAPAKPAANMVPLTATTRPA